MTDTRSEVVNLAHALGNPGEDMAILAEGNVSGRADEASFWIKASGQNLATMGPEHLVRVSFASYASLPSEMSDALVRDVLARSRIGSTDWMPSVETFMHAYLLNLPEVNFVGHTHPSPLISLLSVEDARQIAKQRLFPDEIVCCGPETAYVPYRDPGQELSKAIEDSVSDYMERWNQVPKTIWLANHGLIATGKNPLEVESASKMAVKSARVWLGVLGTGKDPCVLSKATIARIHTRPDEHYRQRILAALLHS